MADIGRNKVLEDILAEVSAENADGQIFQTYKSKSEIGKLIFAELYKRFNNDGTKGDIGFYMDDSGEVGILSQCQSLGALMLLASDFDLKFDDQHIISAEETNLTIREVMDIVIDDLLKRIRTKTEGVYRFDASPYESRLFTPEYSNIEAITWIVPTFLQTLQYHAQIHEVCQWEKKLIDVVRYGIRYINNAFISPENKKDDTDRLEIGWNFSSGCEEPSLYFTYTVCECCVVLYETFKEYVNYLEAVRNNELYGKAIPAAIRREYKKHMDAYAKQAAADDPGIDPKTKKQKAKFDEYNEMRLHFIAINDGIEKLEGSEYGKLADNCLNVAREIWRLTQRKLADNFFYNDLHTVLSEEEIMMSTTSDALFNSVYLINIILDARLHEDILLRSDAELDPAKKQALREEYDDLFESCQLASQKAFRSYEKMKKEGKEYIVEQFLVGFNERFDTHKELVKELRKRRMRVFTLMPLLIRTNNVISEYLIKFPQHNMKKYLGYILENRYVEKRSTKWIWEKDGFFSCSNYYYVGALGEFYRYYEKYESVFIPIQADNVKQRQAIITEWTKEQEAATGILGELRKQISDRDSQIEKLQREKDAIKTPVEDAVAVVVRQQLDELLPSLICNYLTEAAAGLTVGDVSDAPCQRSHANLKKAMGQLLFAILSKTVYDQARSKRSVNNSNVTKAELLEEYNSLSDKIRLDFNHIIQSYIAEISNDIEGRSKWYK